MPMNHQLPLEIQTLHDRRFTITAFNYMYIINNVAFRIRMQYSFHEICVIECHPVLSLPMRNDVLRSIDDLSKVFLHQSDMHHYRNCYIFHDNLR